MVSRRASFKSFKFETICASKLGQSLSFEKGSDAYHFDRVHLVSLLFNFTIDDH